MEQRRPCCSGGDVAKSFHGAFSQRGRHNATGLSDGMALDHCSAEAIQRDQSEGGGTASRVRQCSCIFPRLLPQIRRLAVSGKTRGELDPISRSARGKHRHSHFRLAIPYEHCAPQRHMQGGMKPPRAAWWGRREENARQRCSAVASSRTSVRPNILLGLSYAPVRRIRSAM